MVDSAMDEQTVEKQIQKTQKVMMFAISTILTVITLWVGSYIGPYAEGRFFPVAVARNVVAAASNSDLDGRAVTVLSGEMTKFRECDFKGMEAYLVSPTGQKVIAPINVKETIKLRSTGEWDWGPWEVDLPLWQVNNRFEIYVYHKCHQLWTTPTLFHRAVFEVPTPPYVR